MLPPGTKHDDHNTFQGPMSDLQIKTVKSSWLKCVSIIQIDLFVFDFF